MDIKQLKNEITKKMVNIPNWLDTTSSLHHLVWQSGIQSINSELLKLITNNLISEKAIFRIYLNITESLDTLSEIITPELQTRIIVHFSKTLLYLEEVTIDNESYEATANIKKLTDLYYNINIIN